MDDHRWSQRSQGSVKEVRIYGQLDIPSCRRLSGLRRLLRCRFPRYPLVIVHRCGHHEQRVLHGLRFERHLQGLQIPVFRPTRPSRLRIKLRVAQPSAVAKRQNRGDERRQPGIPDQTWAKPEKVGESDKIAMTFHLTLQTPSLKSWLMMRPLPCSYTQRSPAGPPYGLAILTRY